MPKTIIVNEPGGNFMFVNTLAHDPCHDWRPEGNKDRLGTIESFFKRLTGKADEIPNENMNIVGSIGGKSSGGILSGILSGGNKRNKKSSFIKFGLDDESNKILRGGQGNDEEGSKITDYLDFEDDSSFITIINYYQNNNEINNLDKFLDQFKLTVDEYYENVLINPPGVVTRSRATKIRKLISFVQMLVDYIDYIRLFVVGHDGTSDFSYYKDEDTTTTGGRTAVVNKSSPSIFNVDQDSKQAALTEPQLTKPGKVKLPTTDVPPIPTSDKVKLPTTDVPPIPTSSNDSFQINETSINQLFTLIVSQFKEESIDFSEKKQTTDEIIDYKKVDEKIEKLYDVFEKSLIYYSKQVEGKGLPIYSLINSYFIQDVLFMYMMNSFIPEEEAKELAIHFDDSGFEKIINMRKVELHVKGKTTKELNEQFDKLKEKHKEILFGKKASVGSSPLQSGGENSSIVNILLKFDKEEVFPMKTPKNELFNSYTIMERLTNIVDNIGENVKNLYTSNNNNIHLTIDNIIAQSKVSFSEKMLKTSYVDMMKNYYEKATGTSRRSDNYKNDYINNCQDLLVTTISFLRKNFNANRAEFKLAQEVTSESKDNVLSPQSAGFINNFLKTLTIGVLSRTKERFLKLKKNKFNNDGNDILYITERDLLRNIIETGRTAPNIDITLYDVFSMLKTVESKSTYVTVKEGPSYYRPIIDNVYNGDYRIINNAFVTKDKTGNNNTKIINLLNGKISCPVTSVLDAQGTFGSCTSGINSTNFIKGIQDITVTDNSFYEFNININSNKPSKTSINYYSIYDGFGVYDCNIVAEIEGKLVQILSANNTFKLLLNHIEEVFQKTTPVNQVPDWNVFSSDNNLSKLIQIASKKMIGDFGQELTGVTINGGYEENISNWNNVLLANGDQPSLVRTGFLLLNGDNDINKNATTMYLSTSKGHIYNYPSALSGGGKKSTKKTTTKKRKMVKKEQQKSKTKKISYYINKIYGKR